MNSAARDEIEISNLARNQKGLATPVIYKSALYALRNKKK